MSEDTVRKRSYAPRMAPERRRDSLLDVALRLVQERGPDAISIDAVAKAAGVTRPVVYTHFQDAEDLFHSLLEREGEWALGKLLAVLPTELEGADPVETFVAVADAYLAMVLEDPDRWRALLLPADGTPEVVREFKRDTEDVLAARVVENLRWFFADAADSGAIDLELLARVSLHFMEESGRLLLREDPEFSLERISAMARWFFEAIHLKAQAGL